MVGWRYFCCFHHIVLFFSLWIISPESIYPSLIEKAIENPDLGGSYLAAGQALMAFSIISFMWGISSSAWKKTAFALSSITFFLSIGTGARGPVIWGAFAIIIFLIFGYYKSKYYIKNNIIYLAPLFLFFAAISICVINYNLLVIDSPFLNRFSSDMARDYDELSSIGMRLNYWSRAFASFLDKPIFGQGALSFRSIGDSENVYPHNLLLDALGDIGIVGAVIVVYLLYASLTACWYIFDAEDKIIEKICAALLLYFLGMEMSSGYLYWSWVWPWALIVINAQNLTPNREIRSR